MATKEKTVHISKIKDKTGKKKLSFTLKPITPEKLSPEVLMGLVYDMGVDDDGTLWIVNGNHEKKIIGRFVLYNTEGISIAVSPQIVYVGQRKQISITASLTVPANRITLYRNSEEIYHVEDSISLEYPDIIVPATTDNIVYKVVAVIGSETKTNEATVTVEEDTIESITWTGYSISPSTVQVGMPATFIEGIVTAIYKSGRQEDLTSSAVFNAHRGSIEDHTYIAPSTAGEDTIRASYNGKIADSILTVTIEETVITDYYVGWTNGTKAQFASKTNAEMIESATGYSSLRDPSYTRAFGDNNIFYLMYQESKVPTQVIFTSQGIAMVQDIVNDNICPHADVVMDGVTYKVFGIRLAPAWYDTTDTITVLF
jgi:hypothetical protein